MAKLEDILNKKLTPRIAEQFSKHEHMLKTKEEFLKGGELIELAASDILDDSTFQIRSEKVSTEDFENLKASLKANGQQVPVLVRKKDGKYQLIAGFNRYKALKELKKPIIAIYKEVADEEAFIIAEIENLQRNDLSFTDMYNYINKLQNSGFSYSQIAERLNKSRRLILYYQQIGEAPALVSLVKKQVISFKEAIALTKMPEAQRKTKILKLEKINITDGAAKKRGKAITTKIKELTIDKKKNRIKITLAGTVSGKDKLVKRLQEIITEIKDA